MACGSEACIDALVWRKSKCGAHLNSAHALFGGKDGAGGLSGGRSLGFRVSCVSQAPWDSARPASLYSRPLLPARET
jgi:hypothetical protein